MPRRQLKTRRNNQIHDKTSFGLARQDRVLQGAILLFAMTLRLEDVDEKLIRAYAKEYHVSVSALVRLLVVDKIENDRDIKAYQQAMKENQEILESVSLEGMKQELASVNQKNERRYPRLN